MIAGSYIIDKPVNISGIDKVHLKCDCIEGSIVNGIRQPVLYSFALSSPLVHKNYLQNPESNYLKRSKSVLSHIILYLEDDDYKLVDFNGETISFTCQLIKKQQKIEPKKD